MEDYKNTSSSFSEKLFKNACHLLALNLIVEMNIQSKYLSSTENNFCHFEIFLNHRIIGPLYHLLAHWTRPSCPDIHVSAVDAALAFTEAQNEARDANIAYATLRSSGY